MDTPQRDETFASAKDRLAEIAEAVEDENLSLDEALDLYEEAVALGLKVSDLLEVGISAEEIQKAGQQTSAETAGDASSDKPESASSEATAEVD